MKKKRVKMFTVVALVIGLAIFLGRMPLLAADYNEAPVLKVLVAAGELPPVEERLPEVPMVENPPEIGVYGGSITTTSWPPHYMTDEYLLTVDAPRYIIPMPI